MKPPQMLLRSCNRNDQLTAMISRCSTSYHIISHHSLSYNNKSHHTNHRAEISPEETAQAVYLSTERNSQMRTSSWSTQKEDNFLWQTLGPELMDPRSVINTIVNILFLLCCVVLCCVVLCCVVLCFVLFCFVLFCLLCDVFWIDNHINSSFVRDEISSTT